MMVYILIITPQYTQQNEIYTQTHTTRKFQAVVEEPGIPLR